MAAPLRLCCALLLLQLLLHSCAAVAIYDPDNAGEDLDSPRRIANDDDDEGGGVITVHAGKRKPPPGSRVSPPPPPPTPPSSGNSDCPQPRRKKRAAKASKPLPVREIIQKAKRSTDSHYHCPESWKELDFSEVREVECPGNATGWYPFPPDCRKYLNCWNGRGFLQACAPATLFHPIRRECDYPKKVKCLPSCRSDPVEGEDDGDIIGDPVDYVDPEHPRRPSPLIDVRSAPAGPLRRVPPATTEQSPAGRSRRHVYNARLVSVNGIQCTMEGGTGLQAHPTDCAKFVNCWQYKPHIMSCAAGTLFSTRLNTCDHSHKVTDCVGGKRLEPGVEPPPAQPLGYTQAGAGGGGGGGYFQFGNQGYQPPPRQTFLKPAASGYADQVPAASSVGGYGPNQVLPPPGGKGKSLYPNLQPLQPLQPSQEFGRGPSDPNRDVESIASGGVIGPIPRPQPHPGHNEQWHRQHGVPMPTSDVPPGHNPAYHQHNYHHHHHHQQGNHYSPPPSAHHHGYNHQHQPGAYTPQSGYTPPPPPPTPPGRYAPTPSGYGPQTGGNTASAGGYSGYRGPGGDYTPQPGPGRQEGHSGHSPHWHQSHGIPLPGGHRGTDYEPTTTPSYDPPTTTCPPVEEEWQEGDGYDDDDFREADLDLRSAGSSNWLTVLERTKNTSMPQSGQMVRIRGGPTPLEGYVEVMGPGSKWGSVCDKPANWTVEEATIVCKMLGYERGAELAWQGRPRSSPGVLDVHVESVHCSGKERSLMGCSMSTGDVGDGCNLETQAAGLRCYPNYVARCRPGEVPFKGSCYSVIIPRRDRKVDDIAFSQDEAIKHCKNQGGHLLDIGSQAENDFISEWLTTAHPELGSVLTSGVGVSVPGGDVWVWEDTRAPFQYNLWWPGPPSKEVDPAKAPAVGERPLCILLKKDFPCDTWPGAQGRGAARGRGAGYGSWQGARSCGAEYFFWHAEDCAIRQKSHPYVCERKADDVGCLGPRGTVYEGAANVSWNGLPCVAWDSPAAVSALHYRVSEEVRRKSLSGHNYCRNLGATGGSQEPWCFVDAGASGIKAERCDIPQCRENTAVGRAAVIHCGPQQFECSPNECIPSVWQCDGEPDCGNEMDERSCSDYLVEFKEVEAAKLEGHDVERWLHLSANTCARRCLDSTDFVCKSFSYKSSTKVCLLSRTNVGETGSLQRANRTAWAYYERKALSDPCTEPTRFLCANGKCVNATNRCNGRDDCGDRSDEAAGVCTAATIGYQLQLAGGRAKNEGRIEVKVNGQWGAVCDDGFGIREANVVCREAGYPEGAVEVLVSGVLPAPHKHLPFLVDELQCTGNETSLMGCEQAGWGVHDCLPEEMVGVRCATAAGLECEAADLESPELRGGISWGAIMKLATKHCRQGQTSKACPENKWQCESGECIPATFLCDTSKDCKDGSDELAKRCDETMGMRLVGGANKTEGRLEVKVYGEWGSVCDDDFNEAAARTVCRQLGMPGKARVYKEAHFGEGNGLMWLDDVRCLGNETALEHCKHADFGVTNCEHKEDVGVACLGGDEPAAARAQLEEQTADKHVDVGLYLPSDCGTSLRPEDEPTPSVQLAKVVSGRGTPPGAYPWQASLRVRSGPKTVHWCGAVLIGPLHVLTAAHCLDDYTKGAYLVRVGDYNSEEEDGTEQEANIDSIYVHDDYNKNVYLENDVALIRLAGAGFTMNHAVRPACMPKSSTVYKPGTNCSISGWGSVGTSGAGYSRLLRSAWLPILPTDACSAPDVYGKKAIVSGMFCAGNLKGGADSCQGDSGGPMVCLSGDDRFTLYGIISWGHGCGMPNKPGVYSNVAHYLPWVHDMIRKSVLAG